MHIDIRLNGNRAFVKYSVMVKTLLFIAILVFLYINPAIKVAATSIILPDYIQSVTIDPQNPRIIYAITWLGLYKSVDGGKKWNLVNDRFYFRSSNLVIDPSNTAVMYMNAHALSSSPVGIIKSTDSGLNWHLLIEFEDFRNSEINILIDPNNSSIIYAGGEGCIYKSTDAGLNWGKLSLDIDYSDDPIILAISQQQDLSILYAGINSNSSGILKSVDDGKTWINMINIDNKMNDAINFKTIAVSKHDLGTIYVLFSNRLYNSVDAGKSWKELENTPFEKNGAFHEDIILTNNSQILYLNTDEGVYHSTNSGKNWKKPHRNEKNNIGTDFIVVDPKNHKIVYAGSHYGLYKSVNSGRTWSDITNGLPKRDVNNAVLPCIIQIGDFCMW